MKTWSIALAALLGWAAVAAGDDYFEGFEKHDMYSACRPMYFLVESLNADAERIGLTAKALENAVEARLRAGRMFMPKESGEFELAPYQYLYVNVHVGKRCGGCVFHPWVVSVDLNRVLSETGFGRAGTVVVWSRGILGRGGASDVRSALSGILDEFVAKWLAANEEPYADEEACEVGEAAR